MWVISLDAVAAESVSSQSDVPLVLAAVTPGTLSAAAFYATTLLTCATFSSSWSSSMP